MPLGMEVGLGTGDIVFRLGPSSSSPMERGTAAPTFRPMACLVLVIGQPPKEYHADGYCGQMAGWIRIPFVLDGDPGHSTLHFAAHVYCGQAVAHLSNCSAVVYM